MVYCDELRAAEVEDSGSMKVVVFYLFVCQVTFGGTTTLRIHKEMQSDGIFQISTFFKHICLSDGFRGCRFSVLLVNW